MKKSMRISRMAGLHGLFSLAIVDLNENVIIKSD